MKYTASLFFILILTFISVDVTAQTIDTDRPDQSDGVSTVGKNNVQLEEGVTIADETVLNNFMLRYGLTNSTEIRLLVDAGKDHGLSGLEPLTLSIKQELIQEQGALPAITFVGYLSFPKLASKEFQSSTLPYELKLAFENTLSDKFTLGYRDGQ